MLDSNDQIKSTDKGNNMIENEEDLRDETLKFRKYIKNNISRGTLKNIWETPPYYSGYIKYTIANFCNFLMQQSLPKQIENWFPQKWIKDKALLMNQLFGNTSVEFNQKCAGNQNFIIYDLITSLCSSSNKEAEEQTNNFLNKYECSQFTKGVPWYLIIQNIRRTLTEDTKRGWESFIISLYHLSCEFALKGIIYFKVGDDIKNKYRTHDLCKLYAEIPKDIQEDIKTNIDKHPITREEIIETFRSISDRYLKQMTNNSKNNLSEFEKKNIEEAKNDQKEIEEIKRQADIALLIIKYITKRHIHYRYTTNNHDIPVIALEILRYFSEVLYEKIYPSFKY